MKPYIPRPIPVSQLAWEKMIPRIGMAQASVARFDGILQAMNNQELLLSPLTTKEAVLSSKIEGTQASLEEVLRQDAIPSIETEHKDDIAEVQNYRKAMTQAIGWLRKSGVTDVVIRKIHRTLLKGVRGAGKQPGKIRISQNYIGYSGDPIENAIFIPPEPHVLAANMPDLITFIAAPCNDTIVHTALAHARFELLHPFLDGNGRVGRILIPLIMFAKGIISSPTFYISEYFEENRAQYYRRLLAVSQENDWQGWVDFFLIAVCEQAELNTRRANSILRLYNEMKSEINAITRSQYTLQIIDALFDQPLLTVSDFYKRTGLTKRTSFRIIEELQKEKVLRVQEKGSGSRPSLLVFDRLIKIINEKTF